MRRARQIVDSLFVTLDLGESVTVTGLEGVVLPRYSTWRTNAKGAPIELIALAHALPPVQVPINEELTGTDKSEIKKLIKKELDQELKKFKKSADKDQTAFVKNALTSLFKALYVKRGYWTSDITGSRST